MQKIELLAPAGNLEKAKTAIRYGADAVYIGGKQFSLRSRASNFSLADIQELTDFAHRHGSKVHVTVNILPHNEDLEGLKEYLLALEEAQIDAIIVASPYIMKLAKSLPVSYQVHVSTQHSSTNSASVRFWQKEGMDRVVLGRECTLEEIEAIAQHSTLPLEVFIHGGMCIAYSGRCVLSNHLTMRDANRGGCAQSCRWKYHLMDQEQEVSDPDDLFSMSSKDLQAIPYVQKLIELGIASLKIEGRMKSAYYLATVVSSYRRLIDTIYEKGSVSAEEMKAIEKEIRKAENRQTGPGFLNGIPDDSVQLYRDHDEIVTQEYVADVIGYDPITKTAKLLVRNYFQPQSVMEIFGPKIISTPVKIEEVFDEEETLLEVCNKPMEIVYTKWDGPIEIGAMVRKIKE